MESDPNCGAAYNSAATAVRSIMRRCSHDPCAILMNILLNALQNLPRIVTAIVLASTIQSYALLTVPTIKQHMCPVITAPGPAGLISSIGVCGRVSSGESLCIHAQGYTCKKKQNNFASRDTTYQK